MKENAHLLSADLALICDTGLLGNDTPTIVTRLRGILTEEVIITGPNKDLHSGMYGGPSVNPARLLAQVLSKLHDSAGRVCHPTVL